MLRIGAYTIHKETIKTAIVILLDSMRVRLFGIPRLRYRTLRQLARTVLRKNIVNRTFLRAGMGHFRLMWTADTAISFEGLRRVLSRGTLKGMIQHMIDASFRNGYVTAGYSARRGIDIPYHRGDSLPWLLYMCDKYMDWYSDHMFLKKNRSKIQTLMGSYERQTIGDDGMVRKSVRGDWADTIRRPSSAWNNIMALYTLRFAKKFRFTLSRIPPDFERLLLTKRLSGDYLLDHAGSLLPSVDGAILALYLGVFTKTVRRRLARCLEKNIATSLPAVATVNEFPKQLLTSTARLFAPGYHTRASWIHLGLMKINGYKKLGLNYTDGLVKIESLIEKYGNFIETVNEKGEIFRSTITSEYGFTMSAGQYLEATRRKS